MLEKRPLARILNWKKQENIVFLPHRGFVTETHIDFSLEISGN